MTTLSANHSHAALSQKIIKINKLVDIEKFLLSQKSDRALILVDIDDTVITPRSNFFRANSHYRSLIDDLKKDQKYKQILPNLISKWRLKRASMLVEEAWPMFIDRLKQDHHVYALTKMDTGEYGAIKNVEKWRCAELESLGVKFKQEFKNVNRMNIFPKTDKKLSAEFYSGIFFTGGYRKGELASVVISSIKPDIVVLVDDKLEQLEDVQNSCKRHGVAFAGFHYRATDHIPGKPDPKVAEVQKTNLITSHLWLEDEEARAFLEAAEKK